MLWKEELKELRRERRKDYSVYGDMRHNTHMLFSLFMLVGLYELFPILNHYDPFIYAMIFALFGSVFPDIDHPASFISRGYWSVLSTVIRKTTGHRGWTHSLFGAGLFTGILLLILWYFKASLFLAFGFFLGYISHLISDSLNPTGVNWLWPKRKRYSIGIIRTGSVGENIFMWIIVFAIAGLLYFDVVYNGGSLLKFS